MVQHLITLEIYVTTKGSKPFVDWLNRLPDIKIRAIIRARLNRIRLGNFGDCHSVGNSVHEFRIDYGPGYRIYFGRVALNIVLLLCAGTKGSQLKDIERARQYWEEYMGES